MKKLKQLFTGRRLRRSILASAFGLLLISCGSEVVVVSGITGTGIVVGTITGFGSIIVNGVHYNIDNADIDANGQPYSNLTPQQQQQVLAVGMVVRLRATDNGDGTGEASSVVYDAAIKGPVLDVVPSLTDITIKQMTVLGQTVEISSVSTRFEDFSGIGFDLISAGAVVEISGYVDQQGTIKATLVEKKDEVQPGNQVEVELHGMISDLQSDRFILNNQLVLLNNDTEIHDGLTLQSGEPVEVKGFYQTDGTVIAKEIESDESDREEIKNAEGEVRMQGLVSDLDTVNFRFYLNGIEVDYSAVSTVTGLVNDVEVEVRGEMDNGILVLTRIEVDSEGEDSDD